MSIVGEYYDAIVKVDRFLDVYDADRGWKVTTPDDCAAISRQGSIIRVAPIGHFNAGKTFITSKLCGRNLPQGFRTHTEGLSMVVTPFSSHADDTNMLAWMDTAGLNSPVVTLGQGSTVLESDLESSAALANDPVKATEHGKKLMATLQADLREVKRIEDFHRMVAYEFADVYLFVINQMSHSDQLEILLLLQMIKRTNATKSVYVVHNLQTWTEDDFNKVHDDGHSYLQRIEKLFFMDRANVSVTATTDANYNFVIPGQAIQGAACTITKVIPTLFGGFGNDGARDDVTMMHVFLLNDNATEVEKQRNACTFTHLRRSITGKVPPPRGSVLQEVGAIMTKVQHNFANTASNAPLPLRLVKVNGKWRVHHVGAGGDAPVTHEVVAHAMVLPSYLTLGSDDLQYNVVKLSGAVAQIIPGAAAGLVPKTMYAIQFVLPGLTPEDVATISASMKWQGGGLRVEATPDQRRALVLDFVTQEHVAHQMVLHNIKAQFPGGCLQVCDSEAIMIDEGSRANFGQGNSRTVTVQIRTGLEKLSPMLRPLVAYNDGVLSIVVTSMESVKPKA